MQTIKRNGEYLLQLINDILDLSKIEAGKLEVEKIEFSPSALMVEISSLMRVRAEAKNIPLTVECDGAIPERIKSDPTRLRQIMINLIGNAIKFTEAGRVRVVLRTIEFPGPSPQLQFDVIDSGIGMTDRQIAGLFRPFTQADTTTTRRFGGTGLGLTISKRLARILGGDISVTSALGSGSTFRVSIAVGPLEGVPMVTDLADVDGQAKPKPPTQTGPGKSLNCHVLLAEDGPDNQQLISFLLRSAGAEVTVAENGQIALQMALDAMESGQPFDVILMDMQMPVMDGYTATSKLREAGYALPIVALTAHAMDGDRKKCVDAGCDDYTTKPIDRNRLITVVAGMIDESRSRSKAIPSGA